MIAKSVFGPLIFVSCWFAIAQAPPPNREMHFVSPAAASSAIQATSAPAQSKKILISSVPTAAAPVYEVFAIRYASIPDFPVNALIAGADSQRKLSIAMTVWLLRGNGRNILVDSGFYRPQFFKQFTVAGFIKAS